MVELFFKSKSLKQHALKTALQEPLRKKESKLFEKEANLTKTCINDGGVYAYTHLHTLTI